MSYSTTQTINFTITHARHLAAKVRTDLKRMQRFYEKPTDEHIDELEEELIALLKEGYLESITYGFKRDGQWIKPTLRYTAKDLSQGTSIDDDPGRVPIGADVSNATFYSFLVSSSKYQNLTNEDRSNFKNSIRITRSEADYPQANGYFSSDRSYSSGGRSLDRSTLN